MPAIADNAHCVDRQRDADATEFALCVVAVEQGEEAFGQPMHRRATPVSLTTRTSGFRGAQWLEWVDTERTPAGSRASATLLPWVEIRGPGPERAQSPAN